MDDDAKRRHEDADKVSEFLDDFNSGIVDGLVDDNTLVFDNTISEEDLQRMKEEAEREEMERTEAAKQSAKDLIDSALELYAKNINNIDYVQFRAKADTNTFTKILYQIEINEEAIRLIMNDMRHSGNGANINLINCLCNLQKTEIELWKIKSQYLSSIENTLKQITSDVEMDNAIEAVEDTDEALTAKTRSARDLQIMLTEVQERMKREQLEATKNEIDETQIVETQNEQENELHSDI